MESEIVFLRHSNLPYKCSSWASSLWEGLYNPIQLFNSLTQRWSQTFDYRVHKHWWCHPLCTWTKNHSTYVGKTETRRQGGTLIWQPLNGKTHVQSDVSLVYILKCLQWFFYLVPGSGGIFSSPPRPTPLPNDDFLSATLLCCSHRSHSHLQTLSAH